MKSRQKPIAISGVKQNSPADKAGIQTGDVLLSINKKTPCDVLQYELLSATDRLDIELKRPGHKRIRTVHIEKDTYEPLGLVFETSVFDGIKTCSNNCVFCFINQLPGGMRDALYVKDDDYRLSFLYGNFITLTNLKDDDINRIIHDRLSPLYVSLHATDEDLRRRMLGRKKKDHSLQHLKRLSEYGIKLHIQMVLCPGMNTGAALQESIEMLASDFGGVESVGVVPVGLTAHRAGLHPLRPFNEDDVRELMEQAEKWQQRFMEEKGCPWVYLADEFYIAAGTEVPPDEHYCGYPQIENGIGLTRLFIDGIEFAMEKRVSDKENSTESSGEKLRKVEGDATAGTAGAGNERRVPMRDIALLTGELFAPILTGLAKIIESGMDIKVEVVPVKNEVFAGCVDVTGLLTGHDIITGLHAWLSKHDKPDVILVPDVVLNADGLLLGGNKPEDIEAAVGVPVKMVQSDAEGFIEQLEEIIRR